MENSCPICGCIENKIIGIPKTNPISSRFIKREHYVVSCKNCNSYYVLPTITFTAEQWEILYSANYFTTQTKWLIKKRQKELIRRFDKAQKLAKHNIIKFLDIGVGEGRGILEAEKRGWETTGLDIVDNRIKDARDGALNFIIGDFLHTNFYNNSFDFIYLDSVLEHVINPLEYLIKIRDLLNNGGIIYIGIPNEDSLFNFIRRIIFYLVGWGKISVKLKPFDIPYHVVGFNKKSLFYIIKKVGLKPIRIYNIGRKFEFLYSDPFSKGFWINLLFLFPIEFLGKFFRKDIYYSVYLSK